VQLVLSLFPGIDLFGLAFKREGFCVVQGGDVIFGGDIREEHYPAGKFDGVIGGPPCQPFSEATGINKGRMSERVNLIPEFERSVAETRPEWFVMENLRRAPLPSVSGYLIADYLLNCRWFGGPQKRIRRFSFGTRDARRLCIEPALIRPSYVARTVLASDGKRNGKSGCRRGRESNLERQRHTFSEACAYQGVPETWLEKFGHTRLYTKEGRWMLIGNGVPLPMGRAIAKAVKEATEQ
jgi:DNA (cytosine-5)-methyltransferase 1